MKFQNKFLLKIMMDRFKKMVGDGGAKVHEPEIVPLDHPDFGKCVHELFEEQVIAIIQNQRCFLNVFVFQTFYRHCTKYKNFKFLKNIKV